MPRETKHVTTQGQDSKKKQTKSTGKPDEVVWGGFINIKIDDPTKDAFLLWQSSAEVNVWREVEDTLASSIKLGVAWDSENQCFIATFVGAGVVGSNERYCLTARAGQMDQAIALLVFKDLVMCNHDWGQFKPRSGEVNNWG